MSISCLISYDDDLLRRFRRMVSRNRMQVGVYAVARVAKVKILKIFIFGLELLVVDGTLSNDDIGGFYTLENVEIQAL